MEDKLPKVTGSDIQSRKSGQAIERLFVPGHFICRKENPDFGIDYRFEIVKDSKATNIIFALQLKSQENAKINVSGEFISCEVEVSALSYLVTNKTGLSLFVAYDDASAVAYGEWAHVLIQELDARKDGWRAQANVTVRIPTANILKPGRIMGIHAEVISHNQKISDVLNASSGVQYFDTTVTSVANSAEGSPDERLGYLETNGAKLISAGRHYEVIAEYGKIPPIKWMNSGRHLLNIASAYDHAGMPLQSLVYANALTGHELDANEKINSKLILLNAKLGLGQLTPSEHKKALSALCDEYNGNPLTGSIRLQLASPEIIKQENRDDILRIIREAEGVYSECAAKEVSAAYLLHLRLLLGNLQYHGFIALLTHGFFRIRMADSISRPIPISQRILWAHEGLELQEKSNNNFKAVIAAAQGVFPEMYGKALLMLSEGILFRFAYMRMMPAEDKPDPKVEEKAFAVALSNIPKIQKIFTDLRLDGMVLQTLKHHADVLYAAGKTMEADELMRTVIVPAARMLGLPDSAALPTVLEAMNRFETARETSVDATLASLSVEELEKWERQMLPIFNIAEDRRPFFHKELLAVQAMAKEASAWCKHIDMQLDLSQHSNPATSYTYDANKYCVCKVLPNESRASTNINELLIEFKNQYCKNCKQRSL